MRQSNNITFLFFIGLLGVLGFLGCKKDIDNPKICSPDFEADPPGQWYLGDLHVHSTGASNDTGGDSTPEAIKNMALQRGLHFVVLTDHSNSTGSDPNTLEEDPALFNQGPECTWWQLCAQLSEEGNFLMINGNELSPVNSNVAIPSGHIGCLPADLNLFNPNIVFTDRPKSSVTGGNALQQANSAGCFSIINHPYSPTPWICYDWTDYNYQAIEIWNGTAGFDPYDNWGRMAWLCDLLNGRKITAIGASDNHRVFKDPPGDLTNPPLGYPTTAVFAANFSWPAIMQGLKNGETAIFEGKSRLFLDTYDINKCRAQTPAGIRILRLRGQADTLLNTAQLVLTRATVCTDTRPNHLSSPIITADTLLQQTINNTQPFDLSVNIEGNAGVYTATLLGKTDKKHYGAFSKAVIID
ncbi:MAG: PHP domain-containing protein [Sphingobacteriales bacterium]|jgi:hypothetical protein|nr:PHP domain-containing protein [Sphingobacteriales bacterium]MBP9140344.1 PHP domain-containing protein [Chitinophagales bacterium]MDA0198787.1 CehA/McbA family metallohydrolase [Bacteroidota bacterium]MBK6891374.1 PHP domain-containing protein [Sphingobacteriales bacterium]MBK7526795.1 PHP domain-containing protein [Sphingobacteriales bacterium]